MNDTLHECLDILQSHENATAMAEAAALVHDTLWLAQHVAKKRFGGAVSPHVVCKVADMILVVQEPGAATYTFSPYPPEGTPDAEVTS